MKPLKTHIRLAQPSDIGFISGNQCSMALETENITLNSETVLNGVTAVFNDPAKGFYIVAEQNDAKAACLLITPEWSDWRNAWVWWIQSVYVLPAFRKSGVFGTMYEYIRYMAEKRTDVAGIRLYVDNTNTPAQMVYKAVGMNGEHYTTFEWMKN